MGDIEEISDVPVPQPIGEVEDLKKELETVKAELVAAKLSSKQVQQRDIGEISDVPVPQPIEEVEDLKKEPETAKAELVAAELSSKQVPKVITQKRGGKYSCCQSRCQKNIEEISSVPVPQTIEEVEDLKKELETVKAELTKELETVESIATKLSSKQVPKVIIWIQHSEKNLRVPPTFNILRPRPCMAMQ